MSNVIRFSDAKKARELASEKAGEFLARLDAGASPEDLGQIRQWLAEAPLHREVFLELAALWDQLTVLSALSEVFPLEEYAQGTAKTPQHRTWQWAAAACLMLAVGTGWLLRGPAAEPTLDAASLDFAEPDGVVQQFHETGIGEQATIVLPDNSKIILNTNTVIEVVYTANTRNIFLLRGESLFTVTKDASRPFRVYAGYRMVEAVGTTFSVLHAIPDNVEVVVKEGKVNFLRLQAAMEPQALPAKLDEILDRQESVPLTAGESAAAENAQSIIIETTRIKPNELEVKLAWTHGMLLFQGDTLEDVLAEVNRYTTTKIEADESVRNLQVDGYFRAGDIDGMLVALEDNFRIASVKLADNRIMLHAGN